MRYAPRIGLLVIVLFFNVMVVAAPVVYTQDKPAIVVTADQPVFVIQLKSNPTTGYSWFLKDFNTDLIAPVKHEFVSAADKKLVGAPGSEIWTFRMKPAAFVVPQQTTIHFVYARPWDIEESSNQVVFKVVTVEKNN